MHRFMRAFIIWASNPKFWKTTLPPFESGEQKGRALYVMARKSLAPEKDEMGGTLGRKTTDKTTCTTHSPPNDQVSLKGIGSPFVWTTCGEEWAD
ncbi:hypothetical protein CDAR_504651 [Caerostris darwini]|uniref:Uncharacterized protein n=1 Tax=Caerostris darwini TaxID=1538125 RepID=A0AAV4SBX7_9ARAC|nr:hypothetical protein CDAR_504651 [Caerostris darwini]